MYGSITVYNADSTITVVSFFHPVNLVMGIEDI